MSNCQILRKIQENCAKLKYDTSQRQNIEFCHMVELDESKLSNAQKSTNNREEIQLSIIKYEKKVCFYTRGSNFEIECFNFKDWKVFF